MTAKTIGRTSHGGLSSRGEKLTLMGLWWWMAEFLIASHTVVVARINLLEVEACVGSRRGKNKMQMSTIWPAGGQEDADIHAPGNRPFAVGTVALKWLQARFVLSIVDFSPVQR